MRIRHAIVALTAAALTLTGCGGDTDTPTPSTAVSSSAAPVPKPPAPTALDAKTVLAKLTAAKVGLTNGAVQDENTDPNNLLGRPGGYLSRASADMPGGDKAMKKYGIDRGLVIEVFPGKADADARSKFIQDSLKSVQILGTEYHYRADEGRVLVRVTGRVKPSAAKKVEQAVAGM